MVGVEEKQIGTSIMFPFAKPHVPAPVPLTGNELRLFDWLSEYGQVDPRALRRVLVECKIPPEAMVHPDYFKAHLHKPATQAQFARYIRQIPGDSLERSAAVLMFRVAGVRDIDFLSSTPSGS